MLDLRLRHHRGQELRRYLARQQPVPVLREARVVPRRSIHPPPHEQQDTKRDPNRPPRAPSVAAPPAGHKTPAAASPATAVPAGSKVGQAAAGRAPQTPPSDPTTPPSPLPALSAT